MTLTGDDAADLAFTVARVTEKEPVKVEFTDYPGTTEPWTLFDEGRSPREYGFDTNEADHVVLRAGYQATTSWLWTGETWGQVVERRA